MQPSLQAAIREVVAPYYVDASALLEREFANCTQCYLGLRADDSVHAFFLVQWGADTDRVYLGLSGTSSSARRSGLVHRLYAAFIKDAQTWESTTRRRLVLWGTTASPAALRVVHTMFAEAVPDRHGRVSPHSEVLVRQLRGSLGGVSSPDDHPLVARAVATSTRYSSAEATRNHRYAMEHGIDLLDRLGIIEEHGDRLLFVCRVPQES